MMTKEELDYYFSKKENGKRIARKFENIKIEWETDLSKIDLSVLKSNFPYKLEDANTKFHIGVIKTDMLNNSVLRELQLHRDPRTHDLVEFIKAGNKIIPPIWITSLEYDGNAFKTNELCSTFSDGSHRMFVSEMIGLNEIPAIYIERIMKFYFPLKKWKFLYGNTDLSIKSLDEKIEFYFPLCKIEIDSDRLSEDVFAFSVW